MEVKVNNKQKIVISIAIPILIIFLIIILFIRIDTHVNDSITQMLQPIEEANQQIANQINSILNPTPTIIPDPITIIHEVRSLSRLETIQYSVEKIITADNGNVIFDQLFGDKLLFVAHGIVIAGVDLGKITADDIWMDGGILHVKMPESEIFIATLDNDKSYVYDRDLGLFTHGDIELETLARQAAEDEIESAAINDGILDQAQDNAEMFLVNFLSMFGYKEIYFE